MVPLDLTGSFSWFGAGVFKKFTNSSGINVFGPHKIMSAPNALKAQRFDLATLEWLTSPIIKIILEFKISGLSDFLEKNLINV